MSNTSDDFNKKNKGWEIRGWHVPGSGAVMGFFNDKSSDLIDAGKDRVARTFLHGIINTIVLPIQMTLNFMANLAGAIRTRDMDTFGNSTKFMDVVDSLKLAADRMVLDDQEYLEKHPDGKMTGMKIGPWKMTEDSEIKIKAPEPEAP